MSEPEVPLIPKEDWGKYYSSRTLRLDSKLIKDCGWSWQTGARSMKPQFESSATVARLVASFRTMQEHLCYSRGREELVSSALGALFQRLNDSTTLDALQSLDALPPDTGHLMIQFLVYCLRSSTETVAERIGGLLRRFMKINLIDGSILNGANRVFNWLERDRKIPLHHQPPKSKLLQTWTGQSILLGEKSMTSPLEGPNSECMITHFENSDGVTKSYGWEVIAKTMVLAVGYAESLENAAEFCYRAWYAHHTRVAFAKAQQPAADRDLVIIGNSLSSAEYLAHAFGRKQAIIIATADRDEKMFVLNWPSILKEKRTFRILRTTKDQIELTTRAKLELGYLGMYYYIKKPENYVGNSEFMCSKCRVLGNVTTLDLRYCQGQGPLCGPCRDHMCDTGELSDADFD